MHSDCWVSGGGLRAAFPPYGYQTNLLTRCTRTNQISCNGHCASKMGIVVDENPKLGGASASFGQLGMLCVVEVNLYFTWVSF